MTSLWHDTSSRAPSAGGSLPEHAQLVVVGAGITGLTTALLAQRAGVDVLVLEGRHLGAAATGNTTAKVSLLQGTILSAIRAHHDDDAVRAYVQANAAGQQQVHELMDELGVAYQREAAYTYVNHDSGISTLEKEYDAASAAGLPVLWAETTELPYRTGGAIRLADQLQMDPVELLEALHRAFVDAGGRVVEGVRVTGLGLRSDTVQTTYGVVRAPHVVLATGAPILDRGGHFTRLVAERSYALAFRVPDGGPAVPDGMYLAADSPSRSLRYAPHDDGRLLLVGGNGHEVGREPDTQRRVDELVSWTEEHWPGAVLTHQWSAQDYAAENQLPIVQSLPGGSGIQVATGFHKWGMSNGPAAAIAMVAHVTGEAEPSWRAEMRRRVPGVRDLAEATRAGTKVGFHAVRGWTGALAPFGSSAPAPGEGHVHREGASVVATSNVDGRVCSVSGICTHLGGILQWNAAETSWDCPLHGSRFAADGTLLEGMATKDLSQVDD
ncbi:FAD-dependent oxidoreductase [Nocardioides sp. HDW12B]|uniref:FAD-dependent oxidoreductase n=1 Tax=Nocardioides sp. HDW12B TaxID=2714939 RepID=UPI001408DF45|nr:FAD-dependent oxidoreductase [Nocardioides sp. HDW12B]QIK67304.1 FAD-dependent oxidoreductase [Nocardioides sp. HDW12B]